MNKVVNIGGMELSANRRQGIVEAIAETQRFIDKEMKYSAQFRKLDVIAGHQAHIEMLQAMINGA